MVHINLLAVLIGGIIFNAIGYGWYSFTLFGKIYAVEAGVKEKMDPAAIIGLVLSGLLFALGIAAALSGLGWSGAGNGAKVGLFVALLFVAPSKLDSWLLQKKMKLFLIDAGYYLVAAVVVGIVIGLIQKPTGLFNF